MDWKRFGVSAGLLSVGALILGTSLLAQLPQVPDRGVREGGVGRFQVVRSNDSVIILLDTATGDLYNAVPSDIKPYANRPRIPQPAGFGSFDKAFPKPFPKSPPPKAPAKVPVEEIN
jgi:hypothetical protein